MPIDDWVGVGVPITICDGEAAAAAALVTGATVAAEVTPVVTVAPLAMVMPAPLSLMIAGVGSELIDRLTVTSGFATSAGF